MPTADTSPRHAKPLRRSMTVRRLGWAMAFAAFGSSSVCSQAVAMEMPRDATALRIVVPEFPPGATPPVGGVEVKVTGTVRADGSFEPQGITAEGDQAPFIAAVTGVVKFWRFLPAVDETRCAPVDSASQLSIWFEGSAAQPRIFVSQPPAKPKVEPPAFESIWDPRMSYSGRIEGVVRVLLLLSPDGSVKSAQVRSSEPAGYFDRAVLQVARRTHITWKAPGPSRDLCAQREYRMCIEPDSEVVRHPACSEKR